MSELKVYEEMEDYVGYDDDTPTEMYAKSEADKVFAKLKESHKKEVDRLLMKIAGLEKLVETADKLLKPKGGFAIEDITFKGVKLEGFKKEAE